jgi:hypothetical protein
MSVIPKSFKYDLPAPLPGSMTAYDVVLQPTNNSSFQPSSMIEFQLPQSDAIDPSSMYLNFNITFTTTGGNVAATDGTRAGSPAILPILRHTVSSGSYQLESINDYNVITNNLINSLTLDQAEKYGMQTSLRTSGSSTSTEFSFDSYLFPSTTGAMINKINVGHPVVNMLTMAESAIPSFLFSNLQLQFFLDTANNVMHTPNATGATYLITDVELRYRAMVLPENVKALIKSQADSNGKLIIKSSSYNSLAQTIPSTTVGATSLPFNMRYASLRTLLSHFGGASAVTGKFGSSRPTTSTYSLQYSINGQTYPQRPLTDAQIASEYLELKKAFGGVATRNGMSISFEEYNINNTDSQTLQTAGKHFAGVDLNVVDSSSVLLSGVSSEGGPITAILNINGALTNGITMYTIANYDVLLEVDTNSRNLVARF